MTRGGDASGAAASEANKINLGMGIAQLGLIQAQTEKVKAEAANISGAQTDLQQSQTDLNRINTENQEIIKDINEVTQYYKMDEAYEIMMTRQAEKLSAIAQASIDQRTADTQVKLINQQYTNAAIQAAAMKQGIQLDAAKISEISASIQQKWQELNIDQQASRWAHQDRLKR